MTEGHCVADLAGWSLSELHYLLQELDKGMIRVNSRIQQQQMPQPRIPQQQTSKPSGRSGNGYLRRQLRCRLKTQLGMYTTYSTMKVAGACFYVLVVSDQFTTYNDHVSVMEETVQIARLTLVLLESKLGTSCDNISTSRIVHPMWQGTKYEDNPWRWQFHPDCPFQSFPDSALYHWNAKTCRELLSAFDANQISVTIINAAYRASAIAQLHSESSTETAPPQNARISDHAQTSADVSANDDTNREETNLLPPNRSPGDWSDAELGVQAETSADADNFSTFFAAIREESEKRNEAALAWQESLIKQTLNENSMEVSRLENKIRDAEFASASKSLEIAALEKKIQDEELKTIRRSTDFSTLKAERARTKDELYSRISKLEQASTDSRAEISGLQDELGKANQISENLHLQLTNDNVAHESELQKAKNLASSYSDEASDLKIQLQNAETRHNEMKSSLKFANAQMSTQSNNLRGLKDELEELRTKLAKEVDISTALRKGLEAREKKIEDLQLNQNDLHKQLEKSKEGFQDHQRMSRNWKIKLENCEKEKESIRRDTDQRVEIAKANGISVGRESAIKDMTEERTAVWRGHLKQIEQVRQEAIEIGRASALEGRALSPESLEGLDRARVRTTLVTCSVL